MTHEDVQETEMLVAVEAVPTWLAQTEVWLHDQLRHLPPSVDVHVICETVAHLEQFPIAHLHALAAEPMWRVVMDKGLRKLGLRRQLGFVAHELRRLRPAVLHSHYGPVGWRNARLAQRAGARHVVTFYGYDVNQLPSTNPRWRSRYAELFQLADVVLCEGPHMRECIMRLGCPDEKVRVHRLGIALEELAFRPRRWMPGEPLRVLLAGSFREKKGLPYALDALGQFQCEVPVEVTLIGDATDAPRDQAEKQRILEAITRSGLKDRVRRLGYQPHATLLEEAYRHHVFLSPSIVAADGDTEGGAPVTIIEMAATGMPVVSTTHCDIPQIIRDGETGYLAAERDVAGLVASLRKLTDEPESWTPLVKRARTHIEAGFSAVRQGRELARLYDELAAIQPAI
ncbi:MAG TPA: glycosyltransferase [Gemmatimonadaceae bacterium]|nr:glycosyltransferase [Gemmatimonadaceae bacterium]